MDNTNVMLWVGVVFLTGAGLLATYWLQRFIRGRYKAELLTTGAMKGLMALIPLCWAVIWAIAAVMFFFLAYCLARFAITH